MAGFLDAVKTMYGFGSAQRERVVNDQKMKQAKLGDALSDAAISDIQAKALQYDHIVSQLPATMPEHEKRQIALAIQTNRGADMLASIKGIGETRQQGYRAQSVAAAEDMLGAENPNAPLFGLANGPVTMGAAMGQGTVAANRFKPANEANLVTTAVGDALIDKSNADALRLKAAAGANNAKADLYTRTDPNRSRGSGATTTEKKKADIKAAFDAGRITRAQAEDALRAIGGK